MPKMIGMMRLGRDAELRNAQGGEPVTNLSLAYNYGKPDNSGKRQTVWIDGSLWGKRAEALTPYLLKGTAHCFTLDELHIETFQGRNGEGHKLVARVLDVELGARPEGAAPAPRAPAPAPRAPAPAPRQASTGFDDMDDDIPF